ncbi:hypothetical protein SAMN05216480_106109 [Pustulibacterium marinum]|uniref:Lipoprotein n=1 Tax=Pustulibacterium marinum TaxID=1224947 RepID=A0A1I7GYS8_9FLAO|nr:hypothetical protein [Pustulibacterium marinum]SFU53614.1 hypothetical protein SAMN05216480_106109 [Pustulibacterium marinum]
MKKITLILLICLFTACSGVKKTESALLNGNYDVAIQTALDKLRNNKDRRNADEYILLLEEAFQKAVSKDKDRIILLKKDANPANYETIYHLYEQLIARQENLKPILPLHFEKKSRQVAIKMVDYTDDLLNVKRDLVAYLYQNASEALVEDHTKQEYRAIFNELSYIQELQPNYSETIALLQEAKEKGTVHVAIQLFNSTEMVIPYQLEDDLLNFSTYGVSSDWVIFYNDIATSELYDYELQLNFTELNISPEIVKEKEIIKEKQVKDGEKYVYDDNGNKVKDSLGNAIKVDNYTTVVATFYQFMQRKQAKIKAYATLFDLTTNQLIDNYPLQSEFIFENRYGKYKGDKRALSEDFDDLLSERALDFPSDEQMIYDAGEDIKQQLKKVITRYSL